MYQVNNRSSYAIEHDRLHAETPANGPVRPVQSTCLDMPIWAHVKGTDGQKVRTAHGVLMVNSHGEYAQDTGFHLVQITGHEVCQARAKHELQDFINPQ